MVIKNPTSPLTWIKWLFNIACSVFHLTHCKKSYLVRSKQRMELGLYCDVWTRVVPIPAVWRPFWLWEKRKNYLGLSPGRTCVPNFFQISARLDTETLWRRSHAVFKMADFLFKLSSHSQVTFWCVFMPFICLPCCFQDGGLPLWPMVTPQVSSCPWSAYQI